MSKYLIPFLEAFICTVILILLLIPLAKKVKWKGRKDERHIHDGKILRIGGLAMVLAFNLVIYVNPDLVVSPELIGFSIASIILMLVGFWDDIQEIFWKTQLFVQMSVTCLIFILGVRIYYVTNPLTGGLFNLDLGNTVLISLLLVVAWVVLVINAINWVDGLDGLSGGISLIAIMTTFFLSFKPEVNQPPVAIISIILAGVFLGFLIFNFYPARILAGTSGAMFMGLALAVLAIFSGTKIATAILVLTIPIIDFLWVISERLRLGHSIFHPDKNHLHHKLLEIGWSQKKVSLYYYGATILVAIIALNTRSIGKGITILFSISIMFIISFVIRKKALSLKHIR